MDEFKLKEARDRLEQIAKSDKQKLRDEMTALLIYINSNKTCMEESARARIKQISNILINL